MSNQGERNTITPHSTVIGSTGLRVPLIGFGSAPIGNLYLDMTDDEAIATIHYAYERNIRYFDTAPLYGSGLSEARLGLALSPAPRDSYCLATKVGYRLTEAGTFHDFSREGILRSIDASLARLRTDFIDVLHIHDPLPEHYRTVLDSTFPLLADLRRQGVIRAVGAGMNEWQPLLEFAKNADFDCFLLAGRYTLLEQGALPLLDYCQEKRIPILLGGVFNSGILAVGARDGAKYNYADAPPDVLARTAQLEAVGAQFKVPLIAAAVQFPLAHAAVSTLILGIRTPTELDEAITALTHPIQPEYWVALHTGRHLAEGSPTPGKSN